MYLVHPKLPERSLEKMVLLSILSSYCVAPSSDVANTRGCPEFDASLWSNVYVSPRMNPSVGVSSPLITNLLFATVTVNVVGELALFAVSSAEKRRRYTYTFLDPFLIHFVFIKPCTDTRVRHAIVPF